MGRSRSARTGTGRRFLSFLLAGRPRGRRLGAGCIGERIERDCSFTGSTMDARIVASTNPLSGSWWVTTMGTVSGVIEAIQMWVRELHSGITDLQKSILHPES